MAFPGSGRGGASDPAARDSANDRQARLDTESSANASDDTEVQRLLAHADSLRVANSQLAARIDELNRNVQKLSARQGGTAAAGNSGAKPARKRSTARKAA